MAGLNDWSTTAASNASVGAINWAEGMFAGGVNDSARALMADVAKVVSGTDVLTGWHVKANGLTIHDQSDTTKKVIFDVSGQSAGTTKTMAMPTTGGTLALTTDALINSKTSETVPAIGDFYPFHSASAGAERKITLANLLKVVNSLTEDTSPDTANDFLLSYDASASGVKKVKPDSLVVAGQRVLLDTLTASSSGSLDFTSFDSTKYSDYEFIIDNIAPATDGSGLSVRVSVDGGSNYRATAGDYKYGGFTWQDDTTTATPASASATLVAITGSGIGNATNEKASGVLRLYAPDAGGSVLMRAEMDYITSAGTLTGTNTSGRYQGTTDDVNGIRFFMSSGNIASGTIRCYGIRK